MAFEATHVRFAKDVKETLGIRNEIEYYSGCVYPDSRYVTGATRSSTHTRIPLTDQTSDFDKGKLTHILYDELVGPRYLELLPGTHLEVKGFNESWVHMTAAKLVEDQCSYDALGEDVHLLHRITPPAISPQQENSQSMSQYYQLLRTLYSQKPTMKDYLVLFESFHIPMDVAQSVIDAADQFGKNVQLTSDIQTLYAGGLRTGLDELKAMRL